MTVEQISAGKLIEPAGDDEDELPAKRSFVRHVRCSRSKRCELWSSERRVVGRPSYLIFAQYYSETGAGLRPERTFFNPPHQPLVDFAGEETY